ncbi:MAG TPA: polyprenyl diphosphate synthase [Trebonia sp.]
MMIAGRQLPPRAASPRVDDRRRDAAGRPGLEGAYRWCRRTVRERDPAIYALTALMPRMLWPGCWALWAALATVDDIADSRTRHPEERAVELQTWVSTLDAELATGTSTDMVRRALVDTIVRWGLDVADLRASFQIIAGDLHPAPLITWEDWRARSRGTDSAWARQILALLERAGVDMSFALRDGEAIARFLDGVQLTDNLVDLAEDLGQRPLTIPAEVLDRFPGAAEDLPQRRWTMPVQGVLAHLVSMARHWVDQPGLGVGWHPGPAILLETTSRVFMARLDAVAAAGPGLLHASPEPGRITRWRLFAPARVRIALAWKLTTLSGPPEARPLPAPLAPAGPPPGQVLPPRLRADGVRAPRIAADRMPRHVAIIMDGNGRWAQQRGLPRPEGHRAGIEVVHDVVHGALEIGLSHLTLYAFSTENWKRDPGEVTRLFAMLGEELRSTPYLDHGVRLRWLGHPDRLPTELVQILQRNETASRDQQTLTLTLCLNYGGRAEILYGAAAVARSVLAGDLDPERITEGEFARHLPLPDLPDVDLLWRTGAEQRTSNFLPWHSTYAELVFTASLWPDVDRRDLWDAVAEYARRRRRYGAVTG